MSQFINFSFKLGILPLALFISLIPCYQTLSPLQLTSHGESLTSSQDNFLKVFRVPDPRYRLSKDVLPYHYAVTLRPILTNDAADNGLQWTSPSSIVISVTCAVPTRNITLHSTVRQINEDSVVVLNKATGTRIPVVAHTYLGDENFYVITLQSSLQIGQQYDIFIQYVADVSTTSLAGLYRSHYDDPLSGETKYYATTQFQAFGARAAFPCFDEPGIKAAFQLTIGRRTNYSVLSNTPIENTSPIHDMPGWLWDRFKKTVIMPTYLVALIVSDYTYSEASLDLYNKPVRTYGPKYLIDQGHGDYAAMIAAKQLAYFSDFFNIDYALDKMDSAAMWDFSAGAMENWGLNIYREVLLLYNRDTDTESNRRQIAQTLSHELTHQWFGNLVTCAWWTGAWLNEGFAQYVQYFGLNHTNPEFESLKTRQNDAMQTAMRNDILPNAHPMLLPDKGNPYDTMSYNANLVYSRGSAVLRMVENFLTLSTLQEGLRKYLQRYAYGAVEQDDLFEVLTEQAMADNRLPEGLTMKDIMDTWSLQKGYPLLKVSHHLLENTVTITQEEDTGVYRDSGVSSVSKLDTLWHVPLAIATKSDQRNGNSFPQYWLSSNVITIPHDFSSSEWIVVNSGATGYYRVEYDFQLTQQLLVQIEKDFSMINTGSRSQLLDDYFTRAYTGHQQIGSALGFTKHFANELEYVVWSPFFFHMAKPYRLFGGSETAELLKEYILPKLDSAIDKLVTTGNITFGIGNLLYAQLMDWECGMGGSHCVEKSADLFNLWKSNPNENPIPPLLRKVIYCSAVSHDDDNFQFVLERFEASTRTQKSQLLESLGCTQNSSKAALLLGAADGSTPQITKEFAPVALRSLAVNHLHRDDLTTFIDSGIGRIVDYYGSATIISETIRSLSSHFSTAENLAFVNNLATQYPDMLGAPGIKEVIEAALATIEANILWTARFKSQFQIWLAENA